MEESAHVILGLSNDWDPLLSGNVYANPKARVFAAVVFLNDSVDYDYKYSDRQMNTCQS